LRATRQQRVLPTLLAAALVAAVIGLVGVVVCAVVLAGTAVGDPAWQHAAVIAVGSTPVHVLAALVGMRLGLLLRSVLLATIVLPLGLYALLGGMHVLRPAPDWLTPYAAVAEPAFRGGRLGRLRTKARRLRSLGSGHQRRRSRPARAPRKPLAT